MKVLFSSNKTRDFDSIMRQPQLPRSGHFIFFEARVTSSVYGSFAAPSRILAGLSSSMKHRARPYHCTRHGSQPCPRWCWAWPYHCMRPGTMVRGTAPRHMLVEVGGTGVDGVAPSRTAAVAPGAATSRTIVHDAVPCHVLACAGRPDICSLES